MSKAVAIVSGGMDSVTLAYRLHRGKYDLHLLSFNYGQRHKQELAYASTCAADLGARWNCVMLDSLTGLIGSSSLTSDQPVPDGHYAEDNMKQTVVPNRNAIMLSIAWGVAVSEGADLVAAAFHGGDHFVYPDCRPAFVHKFSAAMRSGNEGFGNPDLALYTPFLHKTKAQIVELGNELGVPWQKTWSCYKGGEVHCAVCGTCTERIEAFRIAKVKDPTEYDPEGMQQYMLLVRQGKVK